MDFPRADLILACMRGDQHQAAPERLKSDDKLVTTWRE
jgi:hypothetical protein